MGSGGPRLFFNGAYDLSAATPFSLTITSDLLDDSLNEPAGCFNQQCKPKPSHNYKDLLPRSPRHPHSTSSIAPLLSYGFGPLIPPLHAEARSGVSFFGQSDRGLTCPIDTGFLTCSFVGQDGTVNSYRQLCTDSTVVTDGEFFLCIGSTLSDDCTGVQLSVAPIFVVVPEWENLIEDYIRGCGPGVFMSVLLLISPSDGYL